MKIAVYAISKNEEQFVRRWVESMSEADEIYVLDTGSTDNTVSLLESLGVCVTCRSIDPWRFDRARNLSLELVPNDTDICVCTDLDEVFHKGWRQTLEQAWLPWVQQAYFRYTWSFQPDGSEGIVFQREKIHARHGFRWVHPVHEVLEYTGESAPTVIYLSDVQLDHHPDPHKSRSQYLPLLELAVKETPFNDRNRHYLGREYFFCGRYDDCIRTLQTHLLLPSAQWADERAASMLYIARSHTALGDHTQAQRWYHMACATAPHIREPWLSWAEYALDRNDPSSALYACAKALEVTQRTYSYLSDSSCWGVRPYALAAEAARQLGLQQLADEWEAAITPS